MLLWSVCNSDLCRDLTYDASCQSLCAKEPVCSYRHVQGTCLCQHAVTEIFPQMIVSDTTGRDDMSPSYISTHADRDIQKQLFSAHPHGVC